MHLVEWLSSLNQLQTNCILLSTVRSFLSYFIFSGKCERVRWCLIKVMRFCPNNIPEHPFLSRQFLYIWLYQEFQWANSTPAAFTLTHKNCPLISKKLSSLKNCGESSRMWPQCNGTPHCEQAFYVIDLLLCSGMFWSIPDLHVVISLL